MRGGAVDEEPGPAASIVLTSRSALPLVRGVQAQVRKCSMPSSRQAARQRRLT